MKAYRINAYYPSNRKSIDYIRQETKKAYISAVEKLLFQKEQPPSEQYRIIDRLIKAYEEEGAEDIADSNIQP